MFVCSKVKELEEELHVVTNSLRSLEISENKVCDWLDYLRLEGCWSRKSTMLIILANVSLLAANVRNCLPMVVNRRLLNIAIRHCFIADNDIFYVTSCHMAKCLLVVVMMIFICNIKILVCQPVLAAYAL